MGQGWKAVLASPANLITSCADKNGGNALNVLADTERPLELE
ncbi:MAG: hypothetical protein OXE78_02805 [Gammaproteobacteria bacterium]|nr:hypothetical protein [Gammaproteobacteria bacterium]MCY4358687.1 hypothetical protein [Gammaproteobacteria bacterium]